MPAPHGLEGVKGVTEFIQPLVQFPFIMRVILPGALAVIMVFPLISWEMAELLYNSDSIISNALIVFSFVLLSGTFVAALYGEIYKIYEFVYL